MVAIVQSQASKTTLLKVTGGIHSGVSLNLDDTKYRIGSSADCDLVFNDSGISPHHMTLRFQGRQTVVEAVGGPIEIENGSKIPVGHGCHITLPAEIRIGDARLTLGATVPAKLTIKRNSRAGLLAIGIGAIALLGVAAAQVGANGYLNGGAGDPAQHIAFTATPSKATPPPVIAESALEKLLSDKLNEKGLSHLTINADGSRFSVQGNVGDQERVAWEGVQSWFDRNYGDAYVLESRVAPRPEKEKPKFHIQAVWFGDVPYAISSNGTRLYRGAAIEDGWIIKDIQEGKLIASRQGEEFILTF